MKFSLLILTKNNKKIKINSGNIMVDIDPRALAE
jgi:hypothetical protein